MTPNANTMLQTIENAVQGLLFPSESDCPIEAIMFGDREPTPAVLLDVRGLPAGTPVEETTLDSFFEGLTEAPDDASREEHDTAKRFRSLAALLAENLEGVRVLRVGKVDIEVFVLGRHESGAWLGVQTKSVET